MSNFKVGDVCVIVNSDTRPELNGAECIIDSALEKIEGYGAGSRQVGYVIGHMVVAIDGKKWGVPPHMLRLKRPPNKDDAEPRADFTPGEWDLCPWQPNLTTKEHP